MTAKMANATLSGSEVPAPRQWGLRMSDVHAVLGINVVLIGAMWLRHGGLSAVTGVGGALTAAGQLTGLYGTFASLVALLLMARTPWLEQILGTSGLVDWHRWAGIATVGLLAAHTLLITLGYAATTKNGVWAQFWDFLTTYPDVLMATVGLALLIAAGATSARAARRRLRYETWYFIHLYAYIGIALGFAHQLAVGTDFVTDPVARAYWVALYLLVVTCIVVFRVAAPIAAASRYRLRVSEVVPEGDGVVSISIGGRHLERLAVSAGQFFVWRFLTRDGWWRAHPFSLSAEPDGQRLRITVGAVGDYTTRLQSLRPGVRRNGRGAIRHSHRSPPDAATGLADRRRSRHHAPSGAARRDDRGTRGHCPAVPGIRLEPRVVPRRARRASRLAQGLGSIPRRAARQRRTSQRPLGGPRPSTRCS